MLHTGELIKCLQELEKMNSGHVLIKKIDCSYDRCVLFTPLRGEHNELVHYVYNKDTKTFKAYEEGDWRRNLYKV